MRQFGRVETGIDCLIVSAGMIAVLGTGVALAGPDGETAEAHRESATLTNVRQLTNPQPLRWLALGVRLGRRLRLPMQRQPPPSLSMPPRWMIPLVVER